MDNIGEVGRLEMEFLNSKFSFCLFLFAGVDISRCSCNSSAFQAGIAGTSSSAGLQPAGYEGYCLSGKNELVN
jgi:hypothetical protein